MVHKRSDEIPVFFDSCSVTKSSHRESEIGNQEDPLAENNMAIGCAREGVFPLQLKIRYIFDPVKGRMA